ncbi:MAG: hypothetical protein JNM36_01320 [Chitinophagales bacterium]|jgi:hypothetical protein|nr:hypothetical protein [Chitinophagales bacterium]HNI43599.1 hypothetical protein [Chitinophagales bacterium]HNL07523.1 hypothetical protein [Chitinophagales bacterium]
MKLSFVKQLTLVVVLLAGIATLNSCHRGYGCPGHITQVEQPTEETC